MTSGKEKKNNVTGDMRVCKPWKLAGDKCWDTADKESDVCQARPFKVKCHADP